MASSAAPLPYGAFRVPEGFPPCFAKPASSGDAKKVAPTASGPIVPKFRMAIVPSKLWSVGQTLKVYLYPNTLTAEKNKWIKDTACEWTRFANLKFDFVDTLSADIRVSFEYGKGNHSAIGRDAHTLAAGGASMNLDPKYLDGKNPNYERFTVLHEFGHALGADHEQQSPSGGIKWNASALYKKYAQINWSKADVDRWIINPTLESTEATPLDALSVMMYVVGPEDTLDGWSTVTNPHLSNWDVQWILRHYPHTDIGINPYTKTASTNWNGGRDGAVYYQDNSACICEAKLTEGKWEVTNRIIGSAKWGSPLAAISWDEGKQVRETPAVILHSAPNARMHRSAFMPSAMTTRWRSSHSFHPLSTGATKSCVI
jgi:serralysin